MKIVALSDLHGNLPELPDCDLCFLGGDICPVEDHSLVYQQYWLNHIFKKWLECIPTKYIIGIAGNHDFIFQQRPDLVPALPWTYLEDEFILINGLKIYGTPWQPIFNHWAFNLSEEELTKKWADIPGDTDILLVHGPPHGYGDLVDGQRVGSPSLTERLKEIQPKIVICGHIHEGYGSYTLGNTLILNTSLLDDRYNMVNKPFVLDGSYNTGQWTFSL